MIMISRPVSVAFLFALGTLVAYPLVLRGQSPATQPGEVPMVAEDCNPMELGFGSCQWLYPLDSPRKKLAFEPKYRSAKPVYYAAVLGDAPDNVYTFVIDESGGTGKGYDTLYVDLNNDNRLDGPDEKVPFPMSTTSQDHPVRLKLLVRAGQTTVPYWVSFTAFPYKDAKNPVEKMHANLRNASYRVGQAIIAGKMHRIALADLNSNGLFNDPETRGIFTGDRFFVDLNDDGKFEDVKGDDNQSGFPLGRYTKIAGQWYAIVPRPGGEAVSIAPATPPLGQVQAPAFVTTARLISPQQPCFSKFTDGKAEAVAGDYSVFSLQLEARDKAGAVWMTSACWSKDASPALTVHADQSVVLPLQAVSLQVTPTVASAGEDLMIGLQITGVAGAEFSWPKSNPGIKPGYEIRDAQGKSVTSATFEYG